MLKDKLVSLLKIHPEEMRMVTLVAALFLVVQAGQGFGDTAAFALFVSHNVDRLPYMYVPLGLIVFLASMAITASLGRFQNANVVLWFLTGFVFLLLGEWIAIVLFKIPIAQFFWLTVNGMNVVLGTLLWTTAGEVCDARQAKRLFPFFTSIGILGSVLGNSLTGVLAKLFGANNMVVLYALVLGGGALLLRQITREYFKPETHTALANYDLVHDLRAGFDFVRTSGLFRLVALTSILYSILFFTIDFPFSQFISKNFLEDEVKVANFKGLFSSVATLITFFVSLFLANRLYTKLGIVNSILIAPVTYLVGLVTFFIFFRFEGAVPVRLIQQVMLGGVMGTAWNALFNVVPIERRGQVLAFMNGVPAQIGVILSGLLLIAGSRLFSSPQQILIMGAVVALVCFYFTWKMRAEYGNALVSALQAGRLEVFSNEDDAFAGFENDPAALKATINALRDPKPNTRRLAAEMLAKMNSRSAISDLVASLQDEDAGVRVAAIQALLDLDAQSAFPEIAMGLDDPAASVREKTLASFPKLGVASSPELIRSLERMLDDASVKIQARAALMLIYYGETSRANAVLAKLLADPSSDKRHAAIDALRVIAANAQTTLPFQADLIIQALQDANVVVRRDAAYAAIYVKDEAVYEALAARLTDVDDGVRRAASDALQQVWPASRGVVVRALNEVNAVTAAYALQSIPPGAEDMVDILRQYIQREVASIRYTRIQLAALPQQGRSTRLLHNTLRERIALSEERLIEAVGLFGNPQAMDLVRKSFNAGDAATRAAALEAFETLGDKRITNEVLPILDHGGMFQTEGEQAKQAAEVIEELLASPEAWLRALAVYAVPELKLSQFKMNVRDLMLFDPVLLVKDAARNAFAQMDGRIMMKKIVNPRTLKTLSVLDRILLLREVPMFSGLSPEDLEKIAEVADELLYSNQALLCSEGEPGNTLFIIASGKVDVLKQVGSGQRVLATHGPSEYVGEMAILESAPRSASLRANGDTRVLVIDGNAFKAILLDRPEVAISVLQIMSSRLRDLNARISAAAQ